jgi:hypothetical protein
MQSRLTFKLNATMLMLMTKTIVHWTEDMNIQSRHPLAQLYGILRIALRSCYWQNHFIEYSCYLQNHLWTTAELTVDNRLQLAISMLAMHYIDTSSICHHLSVYDIHGRRPWQCSYTDWKSVRRCKNYIIGWMAMQAYFSSDKT